MENLEKISGTVLFDKKELEKVDEKTYQGLELLNETGYHGGTSIKYWM